MTAVLGWALPDVRRVLGHVRRFLATALVPEEGNRYDCFHDWFREFVTARVGGKVRDYHRRWAEHGLGEWRKLHGHAAVYALRHLPRHLIEASRRI